MIRSHFKYCLFLLMVLALLPRPALALNASEVLVVANRNAAKSEGLARYYMKQRNIPEKNLVLLFMTDRETCSRDDYTKKAVPPIRRFLAENKGIRAIVTIYGVPLKIAAPEQTQEEKDKIHDLTQAIQSLKIEIANAATADKAGKAEKTTQLKQLNKELTTLKRTSDKMAAFDSELALVKKKEDYDLNLWLGNPFYIRFRGQETGLSFSDVIMVSRLDGGSPDVVKRIINDTIEAEKDGLKGAAYLDARWKRPKNPITQNGYGYYDQSIHQTADILIKKGIPVILEDTEQLFAEGSNLKAALYCGWYRLANYVDAFRWQKGSVGFHIASSECATLRGNTNVWCKKMLDNGIAATIGPVGEPYVQAFPEPQIFFHFLTETYMTLAEAYLVSLPHLSWKMVLIGDPLYKVRFKPQKSTQDQ